MALTARQQQVLNDLVNYIPALKKGELTAADQINLGDLVQAAQGGTTDLAAAETEILALVDADAEILALAAESAELLAAKIQMYTREFDHEDIDVDVVAASTGEIVLGDTLPAGATVLGAHARVTEAWSDGAAGTFDLQVGIAGTEDLWVANGNLDAGGSLHSAATAVPRIVGAADLVVQIDGSVNLSTATAGKVTVSVLWMVPDETVILAPTA